MSDEQLYERVARILRMHLPTEAELQAELARERDEAERLLRLATPQDEKGEA